MRPIIQKLSHLGIAALFGFVLVSVLSTCGGKQKRELGTEIPTPAEGSSAAKDVDTTKAEDVLGTNPTVSSGDDRVIASQEDFSLFQLGELGSQYSGSTSQVSNIDVAAVVPLTQPREVVEKASECRNPGRLVASGTVIAVCIGETKVLWAPTGIQDFVIKAGDEMPMTVLSKPQFLTAFVGGRNASEKFSGSVSAESGNTLLFLGTTSLNNVLSGPGASGAGSAPPATANPEFTSGLSNSGATTISNPSGPITNSGPSIINDPSAPKGGSTGGSSGGSAPGGGGSTGGSTSPGSGGSSTAPGSGGGGSAPGSGGGATAPGMPSSGSGGGVTCMALECDPAYVFRKADTIGYYLADASIIGEFSDASKGALISRRGFEFVPADGLKDLQFLKGGYKLSSEKWKQCVRNTVVGIKIYHLFVEVPAFDNCSTVGNKIEINFPKLQFREESVTSAPILSMTAIVDDAISVRAQTDGSMTLGIEGWEEATNYAPPNSPLTSAEYDSVDTSIEIMVAPALWDMKDAGVVYVAHIFIPLPMHDPDNGKDMKGKTWTVRVTQGMTLGVFALLEGTNPTTPAPFHTLTIQPHLAHLNMARTDVKGAWVSGSENHSTINPLLFASSNIPVPEVRLNRMSGHEGWCGFDVIFAPSGNTAFDLVMALKVDLQAFPYANRFFVNTLMDLKRVRYAKHASAGDICLPEDRIELTSSPSLEGIQGIEKTFNVTSGPTLYFDVRADLKAQGAAVSEDAQSGK